MHNLGNLALITHRETSKKAVWKHNQLPEVSPVYFARSISKLQCGCSETMCSVSSQQPLPNGAPMGAMKLEIIK